jgi:DNA anti-recombination protein RmuC
MTAGEGHFKGNIMSKQDETPHHEGWLNLFKSAKQKQLEEDREFERYKANLDAEYARKAELRDHERKVARFKAEHEEAMAEQRKQAEKRRRAESYRRFIEQQLKIEDLTTIATGEIPELLEEFEDRTAAQFAARDDQIAELQQIVEQVADVVEVLMAAVTTLASSLAASKTRKVIRNDKGDIVETIEIPVEDSK